MKRLSEGATAVTAVFLLLTTAVSFFFAVNRHQSKSEHRQKLEDKRTQYEKELYDAQEKMRAEQAEYMRKYGIEPNQDFYPPPELRYEDFYFREQ